MPVEVTDAATLEAISRLRVVVWRETGSLAPGAFPDGVWWDPIDAHARHWVFRRDGEVVAAGRLSIHPRLEEVWQAEEYLAAELDLEGPVAAPDRVVVARSAQGRGLASRLVEVQDAAAVEAGARHAVRQASPAMQRLVGERGWRGVGPASIDPRFPGVPFQIMTRDLRASA